MKKINKTTLKIFAIIVVPVLMLWIGMFTYSMANEKKYIVERVVNEAQLKDENTSFIIERYMIEVIENLKVIRDAEEFNSFFADKSEENCEEVKNLFVRIMNNKADYDHLRYIDVNGDECIRVDNEENETIISKDELPNQSDAYYFKETILLENNEMYISPLDLNIENGEVEEPKNPVIRISTPIYDDKNQIQGIIIINYKAADFLEILKQDIKRENIGESELQILNGNGEYIIHPKEENNFSFMYADKKELSFLVNNAEVWEQMEENDFIGSYVTKNVAYSYYDVSYQMKENNIPYSEKWIVVHTMNIEDLFSFTYISKELFLSSRIMVIIFLICISFLAAYFIERVRRVDSELEITKKIANATNDAVVITDKDTIITYVNKAYESATGYKKKELIGYKPSDFKSGKHEDKFYDVMWESINETGSWEGKMWDKRKDGLLYPKKIRILSVKDKKNKFVHHYIAIFSDMSGTKRKSDKFNSVYYKEGELTIPNEKIMVELLEQSAKKEDANFLIVYLAIENYNQLVSTFEEFEFDTSIFFADLIQPFIQNDDFVAQTESNLFVAIINRKNLTVSAEMYVKNLRKEIGKVISINGRDVFFKTRIGVSLWPEDTNNIKRLLLNSMIALEWTNHTQESEIAFFNEQMIADMNQENKIVTHLGKAIAMDELSMVYQPQIDIFTGKVIGMEALLRWNSKVLGNVSPAVFIPIAERNYLIIDIGTWVIERVCRDLAYMNLNHKFDEKDMRCAINISAIQMGESGFVGKILGLAEKYKIKTKQIEIEITESLLFSNDSKNLENLAILRDKEITVAIDDFGTGYSSLSYLNTLPIDKIKIDRSFIKNYPGMDDGKLAKILVEMSKTLDIKVLTEGAETKDQVEYLKGIGCNYIQGFYYSKPLKLEALIEFMDEIS